MKTIGHFKIVYDKFRQLILTVVIILIVLMCNNVKATHIVGSDLTYRCLGGSRFEITLTIRRDCINGADSVYFDRPAKLGIFYGNNNKAIFVHNGVYNLTFRNDDTLREFIPRYCFNQATEVCVHQSIYRDTILLPYHDDGYILAYQRCCRNVTLLNILDPLETGTTLTVRITPDDMLNCNSNPVFRPFPPIYVCANQPFSYDHSARDSDADSLVYELCAPYSGKSRLEPEGEPSNPPYKEVIWRTPNFDINNLLGPGGVALRIDRKTGILSGTPANIGQFLVGVCVTEYKNGKAVSFTRREFEVNTIICADKPDAAFTVTSDKCNGLKQSFFNSSTIANKFEWYFDFPRTNAKSTDRDPMYIYGAPGTYEVVLIAENDKCKDTARLKLTVIDPKLIADFEVQTNCDNGYKLNIFNKSTSAGTIVNYDWLLQGIGPDQRSTVKDPMFTYTATGDVTIRLIITDDNGCRDTSIQKLTLKGLDIGLIPNPSKICFGDSIHLVKNPNPDPNIKYNWSPITDLDLSKIYDPIAFPKTDTKYTVTITNGACSDSISVTIQVRGRVNLKLIGDTTTCSGDVTIMAMSDSTNLFMWSTNPSINPVVFTGNPYSTHINGNTSFYVKAGDAKQCTSIEKINILDHSLNIEYQKEYAACIGDSIKIKIINKDSKDTLKIVWQDNPIIVSGKGSGEITVWTNSPGDYVLKFSVTNQFGCAQEGEIQIHYVVPPIPDFTIESECGSLKVTVKTKNKGHITWDMGDNKGHSSDTVFMYTYEKSGRYKITLTVDSVCSRMIMKEITVVEIKLNLKPEELSCNYEDVFLNPGADPKYKYRWTPVEGLDDPNAPNPKAHITKNICYHVQVMDPAFMECTVEDSICIKVNIFYTIGILTPNDTVVCEKTKIHLRANTSIDNVKLTWCDEKGAMIGMGNDIEVEIDRDRTFVLKGIDAFNCNDRDSIHVKFYELNAKIEGDDLICKGDTTMLMVAPTDTSLIYDWSPKDKIIGPTNESSIKAAPESNTTYEVVIDNKKGCIWKLSKSVNVTDIGGIIFAKADPSIVVAGVKTQLTTIQGPNYTYDWSPKDGSLSATDIYNPIAMPLVTTTYTVVVTDLEGCSGSASVVVTVQNCEESVYIPNAFSPNGDNKNEEFKLYSPFILTREMLIYNRWGEEVFHSNNLTNNWDGTFDGEKLAPDVYGYYIKFQCPDNKEYVRKGNVTLLK